MPAEGDGEHRADERDHTSKGGDDLKYTAEDGPQGSERHANQLQTDQPQHTDDQRIECGSAPPVQQCTTCCAQVSARIALSYLHTNLIVPSGI
jgi:hypothetical protein